MTDQPETVPPWLLPPTPPVAPYYTSDDAALYGGEALRVLQQLPNGCVDGVIADPPYSSGGMVRGDRAGQSTTAKYVMTDSGNRGELADFSGDNRDQRAYAYWSALWLSEALRSTRPGGVLMVFTDWRQLPATTDAVQAGGWVWRGIVPWYKTSARPQSGRFTNSCEYVVWGSAGGMNNDYTLPVLPGFYQANPPRNREHITQKPLEIMRAMVRIVPEGGTILDPFMGSGTTGAAAIVERRRFVGIESVPDFQAIAERRIRTAAGDRLETGEQHTLEI